MTFVIDKKATAAARKRQRDGIARLRKMFGFTPQHARLYMVKRVERMVWRARPGVPPLRDPRTKARRRRRKIAHESRRRNRR